MCGYSFPELFYVNKCYSTICQGNIDDNGRMIRLYIGLRGFKVSYKWQL